MKLALFIPFARKLWADKLSCQLVMCQLIRYMFVHIMKLHVGYTCSPVVSNIGGS